MAMESGSDGEGDVTPIMALSVPLFGPTSFGSNGDNQEGCMPTVAASLVLRLSKAASRLGNGEGSDGGRQDHVFARMERESLGQAARAAGDVLKSWLNRHHRVFNPLRSITLSAATTTTASSSHGGGSGLHLSEGGEGPSIGTMVTSSLRGVLDEQVLYKEKVIQKCLPAVARSMHTDWCVVLEVVYPSTGANNNPLVRVYNPYPRDIFNPYPRDIFNPGEGRSSDG